MSSKENPIQIDIVDNAEEVLASTCEGLNYHFDLNLDKEADGIEVLGWTQEASRRIVLHVSASDFLHRLGLPLKEVAGHEWPHPEWIELPPSEMTPFRHTKRFSTKTFDLSKPWKGAYAERVICVTPRPFFLKFYREPGDEELKNADVLYQREFDLLKVLRRHIDGESRAHKSGFDYLGSTDSKRAVFIIHRRVFVNKLGLPPRPDEDKCVTLETFVRANTDGSPADPSDLSITPIILLMHKVTVTSAQKKRFTFLCCITLDSTTRKAQRYRMGDNYEDQGPTKKPVVRRKSRWGNYEGIEAKYHRSLIEAQEKERLAEQKRAPPPAPRSALRGATRNEQSAESASTTSKAAPKKIEWARHSGKTPEVSERYIYYDPGSGTYSRGHQRTRVFRVPRSVAQHMEVEA